MSECKHPTLLDSREQPGVAIYECAECHAILRLIEYEVRRPIQEPLDASSASGEPRG